MTAMKPNGVVAARLTFPLNPFRLSTSIVTVTVEPVFSVMLDGLAHKPKSEFEDTATDITVELEIIFFCVMRITRTRC